MKWNLDKLKKSVASKAQFASSEASAIGHELLATKLSKSLNELLQSMAEGKATIYDKAMDAKYIDPVSKPNMGGGNHRLFDGGHTIKGAFEASRGASADDSIIEEARGAILGLLRDGTTPKGIPLATWDKETYERVAEFLNENFRIPKEWFYDLNSIDASELLGTTIGSIGLVFNWNRAETETFGKMVGSMGLAGAYSANPILLIVAVVALARAFHKAHRSGEYRELADGTLMGGFRAGATIAVVGTVGGPIVLSLLVGIVTGVVINKLTGKVSIVQISEYAVKQMPHVVTEAKDSWGKGTFKDVEKLQASVNSAGGWAKDRLSKFKLP